MYATALNLTGESSIALRLLRDNEYRRPAVQDTLNALVDLRHKHGNRGGARFYEKGFTELLRRDPSVTALLESPQRSK